MNDVEKVEKKERGIFFEAVGIITVAFFLFALLGMAFGFGYHLFV